MPPRVARPKLPSTCAKYSVSDPQPRDRTSRSVAERALVRLVTAYGGIPEFVLLGGLVPDLLCRQSPLRHQGTTDVDLQVDLEIHPAAASGLRLESALKVAGFVPDKERVWRWHDRSSQGQVVKVEFLADLEDYPGLGVVTFEHCEALGAANLRGTKFASLDWAVESVTSNIDGRTSSVLLRVASLPAFLLAKVHAAHGRHVQKDWYDIAFVLLHNDAGGPVAAARRVCHRFGDLLSGATATALDELTANFADSSAQGSLAYATTMVSMYPEVDEDLVANDAVAAVQMFAHELFRFKLNEA